MPCIAVFTPLLLVVAARLAGRISRAEAHHAILLALYCVATTVRCWGAWGAQATVLCDAGDHAAAALLACCCTLSLWRCSLLRASALTLFAQGTLTNWVKINVRAGREVVCV